MKRLIIQSGMLLVAFWAGIVIASVWNFGNPLVSLRNAQALEQPLTKTSLKHHHVTRRFLTEGVKANSDEKVIWQWLQASLASYPETTLDAYDKKGYFMSLHTPINLDEMEFNWYNARLENNGLPPLSKNHQYLPFNVFSTRNICDMWGGLIDLEELELAYFDDRPLLVTQYATANRVPCSPRQTETASLRATAH